MENYLKLPIKFERVFNDGKFNVCSLNESVARNLHLLITTCPGENLQNDFFGSAFWDNDYEIHISQDERRQIVEHSLKEQISKFENRLENVQLIVRVKQAEFPGIHNTQLRYRLEIIINGRLKRNAEPFSFATGFFIGPLMLD